MSIDLMSAVWRSNLPSSGHKFVLLSLADQASDDGYCWPSLARTAKRCQIGRSTLCRYLADLEAAGWLERERRLKGPKGKRTWTSTMYRVLVPEVVPQGDYPSPAAGLANVGPVVPQRDTNLEPSYEPSREARARARAIARGLEADGVPKAEAKRIAEEQVAFEAGHAG